MLSAQCPPTWAATPSRRSLGQSRSPSATGSASAGSTTSSPLASWGRWLVTPACQWLLVHLRCPRPAAASALAELGKLKALPSLVTRRLIRVTPAATEWPGFTVHWQVTSTCTGRGAPLCIPPPAGPPGPARAESALPVAPRPSGARGPLKLPVRLGLPGQVRLDDNSEERAILCESGGSAWCLWFAS
jgi:hypothetical protein